jgi:hypothetical protein
MCGPIAPAENDVTHNFVADWVYDLPRFGNALFSHLIGGWENLGYLYGAHRRAVDHQPVLGDIRQPS